MADNNITRLDRMQWLAAKDVLPPFIQKRMVTLFQCHEHHMAFRSKAEVLKHLEDEHSVNENSSTT